MHFHKHVLAMIDHVHPSQKKVFRLTITSFIGALITFQDMSHLFFFDLLRIYSSPLWSLYS